MDLKSDTCLWPGTWLPVLDLEPDYLSLTWNLITCLCPGTWLPVFVLEPYYLSLSWNLITCLGPGTWLPVLDLEPDYLSFSWNLITCLCPGTWLPVFVLEPDYLSLSWNLMLLLVLTSSLLELCLSLLECEQDNTSRSHRSLHPSALNIKYTNVPFSAEEWTR